MAKKKARGGRRAGAGRPANVLYVPHHADPEEFLLAVMNSRKANARARIDAARALMPYRHAKKGELGKKDQRQAAATEAVKGRFRTSEPPRLAVVRGSKAPA